MNEAAELYVYYRIRTPQRVLAWQAVCDLQNELRLAHPGLQTRVLCRTDSVTQVQTWMEVYRMDPSGVSAHVQADIHSRAHALAPWIDGQRHVEVFVPCAC